MKTRIGFVSNSSTTSFVIYGVKFDKNELLPGKSSYNYNENGLSCEYSQYDGLYVGVDLVDGQKDDETRRQFYDRIKIALKNVFNAAYVDENCRIWKEAYYNG